MMYNFRAVWPLRVSYPRSKFGHGILAAVILPPMILFVMAREVLSINWRN